jgi:dipeptidyl aminopeptidase/acylaminoacyl peptidase
MSNKWANLCWVSGVLMTLALGANLAFAEGPYSGLGKDSVNAGVVQKFAAPVLSAERSRHIQNYLDIRSPGLGILHPNKKELFFSWKVTGTFQVWKVAGPKAFPQQMTGGEDSTQVVGVDPQGNFIVVSRDRAGEENPGLYLQPTSGGALKLIQHKEKVQTIFLMISADGKFIYYRANDQSPDSYAIYKYEVSKETTEALFSEKGHWELADYKDDGRLLLQKAITNVESEFYEWSPVTKKLTPILGQGELEDYSLSYGAKEGEYFVVTNKFGEFRRLYFLKNGNFKVLSPEMKADVVEFVMDRSRRHLTYEVNENGYTKIHALDPRSFKALRLPDFPGADQVSIGSQTRDGEVIMLGMVSAHAPRVSYSYTWKTGKLTQWVIPSAPEIDTQNFVSAKLESYTARDGTSIPMFVRRPPQCETKLCPVVVHFHGGPEGQSMAGFSIMAQLYVDEGFIFVEPNVRGSSGYGKSWFHSDDGPRRLKVITDIPDCADWIKKNWSQNGRAPKVGVFGGSYGGYSTQIAMTKFAGTFDAGVAVVGMSNLRSFLLNTAPYRRALRISEYGDPEKDAEALKELSPITYINQVKAPLLLIQGVSDPRVPVGEALQMYEAMKSKGLEAQLILFADEGHGSQKRSNQVLELGHALEFFKQHLK